MWANTPAEGLKQVLEVVVAEFTIFFGDVHNARNSLKRSLKSDTANAMMSIDLIPTCRMCNFNSGTHPMCG